MDRHRHGGFFEKYVMLTFICGCLVAFLFWWLCGLLYFLDKRSPRHAENALYLAVQGKSENSAAKKVAEIVKRGVTFEGKFWPEYLAKLKQLSELDLNEQKIYLNLLVEKSDNILNLAQGKAKAEDLLVEIPSWRTYFKWVSLLSWLTIAFLCTTELVVTSLREKHGLWAWPWRRAWVYLWIIILFPALAPAMFVELCGRVVIFGCRLLVVRPVVRVRGWLINDNPTKDDKGDQEVVAQNKPRDKKQQAIEIVKKAKSRSGVSREKWVAIFLKDIADRTGQLQKRVAHAKNHLTHLGQEIARTQDDLIQSSAELTAWEDELKEREDKTTQDFLAEYARLLSLPGVEAVEITDNNLAFYTNTIIEYKKERYEIGIFVVQISLWDGLITLNNLCSTHPSGRNHPYAGGNVLCFGKMRDPLNEAIRRKNYVAAVQYILAALQSAEGDNPGIVKEWREVKR